MVELENIPQGTREKIERVGAADLVIAVLAPDPPEQPGSVLTTVREALAQLSPPPRTVVIHGNAESGQTAADFAEVLPFPAFTPEAAADPVRNMGEACHAAFVVGGNLAARACVVIGSDPEAVTSQWIQRLIQPVLELDFDLVTPCYAHHKFKGLLNSSIVSPLTRALYGKQIQHPMGPDFGFSARSLHLFLGNASGNPAARPARPLATLVAQAVCGGLEICQAHVGLRFNPPTDWTNLSSVLAQILGPLFLDLEQNAAFWQRIRGSQAVPEFGERGPAGEETGAVDVQRMIDSFRLGCGNLLDVWRIVLPPATLFELTKLARLATNEFRMPDELWVRIIYDFALGHRLRTINRDHLLRAMTPLYLAWVASYALELETAGPDAVDRLLERLSMAYEAGKPYLLSRWRWPDRFNP